MVENKKRQGKKNKREREKERIAAARASKGERYQEERSGKKEEEKCT